MNSIVFRDGFLSRVKEAQGIKSDDAMARLLGVSRPTYLELRDQRLSPSIATMLAVYEAWGFTPGECVTVKTAA